MTATELRNATAVVTGGAGGIGTAVVARLAREGASVAVLDLRQPDESAITTGDNGSKLWYRRTDLADPVDVSEAFTSLRRECGAPAILVNAAGVATAAPFLETTVEEWDRTLDVNARAIFVASQEAARQMKENGGGRIINILSTASQQGFAHGSAYCASKGAALMLTRTLAIELASYNITVNGVAPGTVRTPAASGYIEDPIASAHELARTPLRRFGEPHEIAEVVAFLATRATWITGETIYVDGGFLVTGMPPLA